MGDLTYFLGMRFRKGDREWQSRDLGIEDAYSLASCAAHKLSNDMGVSGKLPKPCEVRVYARQDGLTVGALFSELRGLKSPDYRRIEEHFEALLEAAKK